MQDKEQKWKELFGSEFDYIKRLGAAISDPHDKREFWENVKAKKEANSSYSIYDDFPKAEVSRKRIAQKYCGEILEMLKKRRGA